MGTSDRGSGTGRGAVAVIEAASRRGACGGQEAGTGQTSPELRPSQGWRGPPWLWDSCMWTRVVVRGGRDGHDLEGEESAGSQTPRSGCQEDRGHRVHGVRLHGAHALAQIISSSSHDNVARKTKHVFERGPRGSRAQQGHSEGQLPGAAPPAPQGPGNGGLLLKGRGILLQGKLNG